jgi:hypothetical protein
MNIDLITIRLKAFLTEVLTLIAIGVIALLSSPEFAALLTKHFGEVWGGSVGLLLVSGIVKHLMNLEAVRKYKKNLAGEGSPPYPVLM